jgi:hypothetical protein
VSKQGDGIENCSSVAPDSGTASARRQRSRVDTVLSLNDTYASVGFASVAAIRVVHPLIAAEFS